MKLLQRYLHKVSRRKPAIPENYNPFSAYLSANPSVRSKSSNRSLSSSPSSPSSPASLSSPDVSFKSTRRAASPSVFHSPTASPCTPQKRSLVDCLFELENNKFVEAFRIIDTNRDGRISEQELDAMWQRLGKKLPEKEIWLMIQQADTNGDGVLDLEEFIAFLGSMAGHPEIDDPLDHACDVRLAFDVSDLCRDGLISAVELQTVMRRLRKRKVTADECAAMIEYVDHDGDGLITYAEFEKLMMSSIFS